MSQQQFRSSSPSVVDRPEAAYRQASGLPVGGLVAPSARDAEAFKHPVIRAIAPSDVTALQQGFTELSPESRYFRFHAPMARIPDRLAHYLTHVDGVNHVALVAFEREGRGLGVARFVRNREAPDSAELAITVAEHARGQGIAHRLLHRLAGQARERGLDTFTMLVLRENHRARRLLTQLGAVAVGSQGDVLTLKVGVRHLECATAEVSGHA